MCQCSVSQTTFCRERPRAVPAAASDANKSVARVVFHKTSVEAHPSRQQATLTQPTKSPANLGRRDSLFR